MRRRKTIAYLLICIVLLPLVFSTGLQVVQQGIKYGVSNRLATEDLIIISIPLAQVQWMEEGREIMVEGKMFDIKNYEQKGGYLIAQGVYDEHETTVVNLLHHFGDKEQSNFLFNLLLLTQTFLVAIIFFLVVVSVSVLRLKHFVFYLLNNILPISDIPHQPPRKWNFKGVY